MGGSYGCGGGIMGSIGSEGSMSSSVIMGCSGSKGRMGSSGSSGEFVLIWKMNLIWTKFRFSVGNQDVKFGQSSYFGILKEPASSQRDRRHTAMTQMSLLNFNKNQNI